MRNTVAAAIGAAVLLTGCTGAPAGVASPGVVPEALPTSHVLHGDRSWMTPDAAGQDLLYVSNGNGEVTVYRYWQRTLVGVLTDMTKPMGECVDKTGDVYVADFGAEKILEFAHGGTKPIATFNDAPDSPYACSIDPTSGKLAVANDDGSSAQGNIAVWTSASSARTTYSDSTLGNFQGCGFDGSGNLLATNGVVDYSKKTGFAWLPKNGTKLININVPGPSSNWRWGAVMGVQWDGKFLAIDEEYAIYRISLMHGQAYYVGTSEMFAEEENNTGPYAIYNNTQGGQGTQVVGGMHGESVSEVAYWDYPAGGSEPIATITHGVDKAFGVAISLKK